MKRSRPRWKALSAFDQSNTSAKWGQLIRSRVRLGIEGIVAKRADAPYKVGRSGDWIKIRTPAGRHTQERRSEEWRG